MRHPLARAIPLFSAEPESLRKSLFLFAVKFDPQMKEMGGAQSSSARHFAAAFFGLEGVSQAEIDLDEVFHSGIEVVIPTPDPVIAGLAKESDMGSKPILESTADVGDHSIVRYVRRCIIEPVIYPWKGRVYGVSSRAGEKTAAAAEYVWRQVNTRPEVIQRESQDEVMPV